MKKKKIEVEEKNWNHIIDLYNELIFEYYKNVNTKFDIKKVSKQLDIDLILIKELVKHLSKKKYIKIINYNTFQLTYEGMLYLEEIVQNKKGRNRDLIALFLSMVAVILSIAPIFLENVIFGLGLLFLAYKSFKWAFREIGGIK